LREVERKMKKTIFCFGLVSLLLLTSFLTVSAVSALPSLEIRNITNPRGEVRATIRNNGGETATNVRWSFTFTGGVIILPWGRIFSRGGGDIASLEEAYIKTPVFGIAGIWPFTPVTVTISANCNEVPTPVTAIAPYSNVLGWNIW
jgi:hypothetical protein